MDREHLIELLERFGAAEDATVLGAARDAHALIAGAGLTWGHVINGPDTAEDRADDGRDEVGEELPDEDLDSGEALQIVTRLLARADLYEETREELLVYKRDIESGEFDTAEQRYLRALDRRLSTDR